ncbi:hypothetical protein [Ruegeria sp.]|uniref:hypothetical protein n=1 Tax=Ruegeria sp. TaxID=1879320 RepID=UPI003B5B66CB
MTFSAITRVTFLSVALASPVVAKSPIAEVICEPTARMHDKLERQFRSERTATGMRGPEQVMEVWTSKSGDWTMVVTYATGTSCIVAMGEDWHTHAESDPARG